jgi:tetratricopeptide (TPR) repeat protein
MKNHIIITLLFTFLFSVKIFGQTESISVNELMQKGQYAQALVELEKLNIEDSTQIDVLQKQALCNLKLGRIAQARKLYQSLLLKNPDSVENLLQIATIYEKEYNLSEAFKVYQKLNSLDSLNTFYWKELARVSIRMERAKDAISNLKKAVSIDDKDLESLASLSNLYLNKGDEDLAEPLIKKAFELDSSSIRIRHLRSRLSYISSDFQGVMKDILFTMSLGDSTAYYQRFLGTAYYYLDSLPKSIATFKRLINVGEKTENVYAGLAFSQLKLANNEELMALNEANNNFSEAVDLGTSDRLSDYEIGMADVQDKLGYTDNAIRLFTKLLQTRPKAVFRLGEIYEKKKQDKDMAILYYQEYIKACGRQKKPTPDCNFIDLAKSRINALNPKLKLELPQTAVAKDSTEMAVDTIRHDEK